jgi:nicotinate-nucleotide--dimethylbenzimidazole phosphoribosyltransferase
MDAKTKPLGALGALEECAVRLAVMQRTHQPRFENARVCVFGADHGVTDEGVSAYPRAVTAEMMKNFDAGGAAINVLARANGVDVEVIDVGVDAEIEALANVRHTKVRRGTRNFVHEAAMTEEELMAALAVGNTAARRAFDDGMHGMGLGEMGIGNTTSASTLLSVLTGHPAQLTVGRGTGVSAQTLQLKRDIVTRALLLHGNQSGEIPAREWLRRVGGFELAAIAGAALEAACHRMVVIADGFISTVAILCAARMAREFGPAIANAFSVSVFLSHRSAELGHQLAIDAYAEATGSSQKPLLDLGLRLGEGTGAVLAIPLIRSAAAIMRDMATFDSAGISAASVAHG